MLNQADLKSKAHVLIEQGSLGQLCGIQGNGLYGEDVHVFHFYSLKYKSHIYICLTEHGEDLNWC